MYRLFAKRSPLTPCWLTRPCAFVRLRLFAILSSPNLSDYQTRPPRFITLLCRFFQSTVDVLELPLFPSSFVITSQCLFTGSISYIIQKQNYKTYLQICMSPWTFLIAWLNMRIVYIFSVHIISWLRLIWIMC